MSQTLSEFYIKKAKSELREDENRKEQSVKLFREWALKHPFIQVKDPEFLRTDFVLSYLRPKKYSMEKTYESFEKIFLLKARHESWFDFEGESLKRILALYDDGFLVLTKERDSEGRRVMIMTHKLDATRFTSNDVMCLIVLIYSTLSFEEETQISGVILMSDGNLVTMNYLALYSLKDIYDHSSAAKIAPIRMKKIIFFRAPPIAAQVLKIIKTGLSDKLKKRVAVLGSCEELKKHIDVAILPKEYGGKFTTEELIADFKPKILEHVEVITRLYQMYKIDVSKIDNCQEEVTGTFRKLEID